MWAPVDGRYGRTRDGRKVGPMVRDWTRNPDYPWRCDRDGAPSIGVPLWTAMGYYQSGVENHPLDLVAEWVDESTGPVRQRTVWDILPGVYGLVTLLPPSPGVHTHIIVNAHDASADELDAASRVLTQLAEALRHG